MLYLSIDFSFFFLAITFPFFPFCVACLKGEKVEVVSFFSSSCFSFVLVRAGGWGCVFIHGVTVLRAPGKERERERGRTVRSIRWLIHYIMSFFLSIMENFQFYLPCSRDPYATFATASSNAKPQRIGSTAAHTATPRRLLYKSLSISFWTSATATPSVCRPVPIKMELFEFVTFSSRGFATLLLRSYVSSFWYSGTHSCARLGQLMPLRSVTFY